MTTEELHIQEEKKDVNFITHPITTNPKSIPLAVIFGQVGEDFQSDQCVICSWEHLGDAHVELLHAKSATTTPERFRSKMSNAAMYLRQAEFQNPDPTMAAEIRALRYRIEDPLFGKECPPNVLLVMIDDVHRLREKAMKSLPQSGEGTKEAHEKAHDHHLKEEELEEMLPEETPPETPEEEIPASTEHVEEAHKGEKEQGIIGHLMESDGLHIEGKTLDGASSEMTITPQIKEKPREYSLFHSLDEAGRFVNSRAQSTQGILNWFDAYHASERHHDIVLFHDIEPMSDRVFRLLTFIIPCKG